MSNQQTSVTIVSEVKRGLKSLLEALAEEKAGNTYWMTFQAVIPVANMPLEEYTSFVRHTIQSLSAFKDEQVINCPLKYGISNPAEAQLASRTQELYMKKVEDARPKETEALQDEAAATTEAVADQPAQEVKA